MRPVKCLKNKKVVEKGQKDDQAQTQEPQAGHLDNIESIPPQSFFSFCLGRIQIYLDCRIHLFTVLHDSSFPPEFSVSLFIQYLSKCSSQIQSIDGFLKVFTYTKALCFFGRHSLTVAGTNDHWHLRSDCQDFLGQSVSGH